MPDDIAESAAQEETGFALPSQQQKFSGGSHPPPVPSPRTGWHHKCGFSGRPPGGPPQGASSAPEGAGRKMGNPPFSTLHSMLML